MNLLYVGDTTTGPVLDQQYYNSLRGRSDVFIAEEISCIAAGDARCEVVAQRSRG